MVGDVAANSLLCIKRISLQLKAKVKLERLCRARARRVRVQALSHERLLPRRRSGVRAQAQRRRGTSDDEEGEEEEEEGDD